MITYTFISRGVVGKKGMVVVLKIFNGCHMAAHGSTCVYRQQLYAFTLWLRYFMSKTHTPTSLRPLPRHSAQSIHKYTMATILHVCTHARRNTQHGHSQNTGSQSVSHTHKHTTFSTPPKGLGRLALLHRGQLRRPRGATCSSR